MNKADEFFMKHLYHPKTHKKESKKAYETRIKWKELGFPSYSVLESVSPYSISTIKKNSTAFEWLKVKEQYFKLLAEVKIENKEKEIIEMEEDYSDIWESIRDSFRKRVCDLSSKLDSASSEKEVDKLFKKFNDLIKSLEQTQKAERLNYHLPNSYKENEKIELEQKGNLNIGVSEETVNLFEKIKEIRKEEES